MKYLGLTALLIFISFLQPSSDEGTFFVKKDLNLKETMVLIKKKERAERINTLLLPGYSPDKLLLSTEVTVSSYNPLKEQCDNTPLINSSNQLVLPGQVAIPKGFRLRIGLKLGDIILLEGLGLFYVTDHMNSRYDDENRIDIISFIPKWSKKFGVKHNIKMYWWR